jgi:hypothetical protein
VPADDLTYPDFHYKCNEALLKKFETLGVIRYLTIVGTQVTYSFSDSFQKVLNKELDEAHHFIVTDETVDEDIVTMSGVIRTVADYIPKGASEEDIYRCSEFVFNSLMMQKHGRPVPTDKKFHSRIEEYGEEVYTIPTNEAMANHLKAFKKMKFGM